MIGKSEMGSEIKILLKEGMIVALLILFKDSRSFRVLVAPYCKFWLVAVAKREDHQKDINF